MSPSSHRTPPNEQRRELGTQWPVHETVQPLISRRDFVGAAVTVSGGLVLGVNLRAQEEGTAGASPVAAGPRAPSAFIQISEDDIITIVTPAVEMGQGGHTAMPMMVMEELGGNWQRLHVADADAAVVYNNPMFGMQATVGSFSVRGWYTELRRIGAAAREMLLQAAATEWNVPVGECTAGNSLITHRPRGLSRSFGSVAARASKLPIPQDPPLKSQGAFGIIGTSPLRVDIPAKVDGSARYGIDVVLPGMLYAAVKTSPTLGGTLKSLDDSAAKRMPGYRTTVPLPDGVIVVARSYWQAKKALDQVKVVYEPGALAGWDSVRVTRTLHEGFDEPGKLARHEGDVPAALEAAATRMEADYEVPYLAHACMEPMNCTARVDATRCEVWCGTQAPQAAQAAAAAALNIPREHVKVTTAYLGGGFGRRGQADYVAQAVIASRAAGQAVKLIWSREEDIQHDYYRPAAAIRFRAGLNADGELTVLDSHVVTAASSSFERPDGPPSYTGGVSDTTYSIPNLRVIGVNKDIGVRFGFWRSVNDSHNPFMLEGFIDEIASRTKRDPYEFRRSLLRQEAAKRQLAVLDLVAAKAEWNHRRPGHFLGISAFKSFGSYIGCVVDITVKDNKVTLHRVVTAIDCGVAIHPDNIKAQLEGGMVYGLTAVLRGEITLENGAVRQSNFHDYPMLIMSEMPTVECFVVPSSAPPGGVGEPGTGPIAPSLANAVYAATGKRLRSLPLSKHGLTFAAMRA
jgi:isoquinoline 1-oxidoreductase beta subunit